MAGFIQKVKDMFISEEEREIRARMKFNQTKRDFQKYYEELDATAKSFSKMARDAEISGNHDNALSAASFVGKLQRTQVKVQGLLQHFEMMHSMQRLAGVMTKFVSRCAEMGVDIDSKINFHGFEKNVVGMEQALNKLELYSDQVETVIDTIEEVNMTGGPVMTAEEKKADAESILNGIMGRENAVHYPAAGEKEPARAQQPAEAQRVAVGQETAEPPETPADDSSGELAERIRMMRQELNSRDE